MAVLPAEDRYVDASKVRYGSLSSVKWETKPAVGIIRSKVVYRAIQEYQTIIKEGIKPGTARYTQLMSACTKRYRAAVRAVAMSRYVLIVEQGGVSDYPTTDVTEKVIKELK